MSSFWAHPTCLTSAQGPEYASWSWLSLGQLALDFWCDTRSMPGHCTLLMICPRFLDTSPSILSTGDTTSMQAQQAQRGFQAPAMQVRSGRLNSARRSFPNKLECAFLALLAPHSVSQPISKTKSSWHRFGMCFRMLQNTLSDPGKQHLLGCPSGMMMCIRDGRETVYFHQTSDDENRE